MLKKLVILVCVIGACSAAVYNIQPQNKGFAVVSQETIDDDLSVAESIHHGGYERYGGGYNGCGGYGGYGNGGYGGYGGGGYGGGWGGGYGCDYGLHHHG